MNMQVLPLNQAEKLGFRTRILFNQTEEYASQLQGFEPTCQMLQVWCPERDSFIY